MSEHRETSAQATAALLEIIARGQALQAAVIRGDAPEAIEAMRQEAMAMAEAYFDRSLAAARAVRAMIDGHPDAASLGEQGARRLLD